MFLKFQSGDGQQDLVVETNSYQVHEKSGSHKCVLIGESSVEYWLVADGPESLANWAAMFVMNDRGETVDRVSVCPARPEPFENKVVA